MKFFYTIAFVVLVSLLGTSVSAQDAAAVLADVSRPVTVNIDSFTECVKTLVSMRIKANKAIDTCESMAKREAKRSERVSGNAARANQPTILDGSYTYGGYFSRKNTSWSHYNR